MSGGRPARPCTTPSPYHRTASVPARQYHATRTRPQCATRTGHYHATRTGVSTREAVAYGAYRGCSGSNELLVQGRIMLRAHRGVPVPIQHL
eukprot:117890-Rhodomonas_salina.2